MVLMILSFSSYLIKQLGKFKKKKKGSEFQRCNFADQIVSINISDSVFVDLVPLMRST